MKIFWIVIFFVVAIGYMETRSQAADHRLSMYEQRLNQRLAVEYLPVRMVKGR